MKLVKLIISWLVIGSIATACAAISLANTPPTGPTLQATQAQAPVNTTADRSAPTLVVFAAASLTGAFQEIGQSFEAANPGVRVSFNFAGSQILRTQLEQGAVADVFASADQKNMDLLVAENLVVADAIQQFATNSLIVIIPANNPGSVQSLADLARPGLKLVLADASVPAGGYARQVLAKMSQDATYGADFNTKVLSNVVSNETDVKQVVTKVELGEADAGIVYVTDAVAAPGLLTLTIPDNLNVIASYPIAVLTTSPEPDLAKAFEIYVTSPSGQAILAKWGFGPAVK